MRLDLQVVHSRCIPRVLRVLRVPHKSLVDLNNNLVYELDRDEDKSICIVVSDLKIWLLKREVVKFKKRFVIEEKIFYDSVKEWMNKREKYNLFLNNCWSFVKDIEDKQG